MIFTKLKSQTRSCALVALATLPAFAAGCDSEAKAEAGDADGEKKAEAGEEAGDEAAKAEGEGAEGAAIAEAAVVGGDACERLFSPAIVGKAAGVDLSDYALKSPMSGTCSLGTGGTDYRFALSMSVHEDAAKAVKRFEMITQSHGAKETAEAMKAVQEQAAKKDPSMAKKSEPIADIVNRGGVQSDFEDLSGLGDQARMNIQRATVGGKLDQSAAAHVRFRNLTFVVSASAKEPDLEKEKGMNEAIAKAVLDKLSAM